VVSGSDDSNLCVWNMSTGECEQEWSGHSQVSEFEILDHLYQRVKCVCTLKNGIHVVSGSDDCTLRVWNVTTGVCEYVLRGHKQVSQL
jgi:WD40 repeat protein